jgi:hypothetical protein
MLEKGSDFGSTRTFEEDLGGIDREIGELWD